MFLTNSVDLVFGALLIVLEAFDLEAGFDLLLSTEEAAEEEVFELREVFGILIKMEVNILR